MTIFPSFEAHLEDREEGDGRSKSRTGGLCRPSPDAWIEDCGSSWAGVRRGCGGRGGRAWPEALLFRSPGGTFSFPAGREGGACARNVPLRIRLGILWMAERTFFGVVGGRAMLVVGMVGGGSVDETTRPVGRLPEWGETRVSLDHLDLG